MNALADLQEMTCSERRVVNALNVVAYWLVMIERQKSHFSFLLD